MAKQNNQKSKKRQRIQTVEEGTDTKVESAKILRRQQPDYFIWVLAAVVAALALLVWKGITDSPPKAIENDGKNSIALAAPITNKSDLAAALSTRLNTISPTPPLGQEAWIALQFSFVLDKPYAYVTYTDTHITLRILLEYEYNSTSLTIKVLATFLPDEQGIWQLQYGRDLSNTVATEDYIYYPGVGEWALSDTNDAN